MTRSLLLCSFVLSVLVGCDKGGVYHYGVRTDVVEQLDTASIYLRSTDEGTDMVIFGSPDPLAPVDAAEAKPFLSGTVMRDSSTSLLYGTYELAANGEGIFHVSAAYNFQYQPDVAVSGRDGSMRTDSNPPAPNPFQVHDAGNDQVSFTIFDTTRTYTRLEDILAGIDVSSENGPEDVFQLYNLALFFSQVRIPAFGGLGMTRYIPAPGNFVGIVGGDYSVSVKSLVDPTATIAYHTTEDFPGIMVDGDQVTVVDIQGDGHMRGVLSFEFRDHSDPPVVLFAGTVDYADISIHNGIASGGTYTLNVTTPTTTTATLPFTLAANVDLRRILPVQP